MTDQSIPEVMYTMISLLFLLLGIVLLATILMSALNPYEQVVYANTEKLRSAMDQACLGNPVSSKFNFPQNTPAMTGLFTVLPIWIITTNGDPNYVLYYESFPPGEATGWEVYQNMQNRLITYLPDGWEGRTVDDVDKYVEDVVKKTQSKTGLIEGVVVSNIEIGKIRTDYYVGQKSGGAGGSGAASAVSESPAIGASSAFSTSKRVLSEYGDWQRKNADGEPLDGDNYFKFKNYIALNAFEKSAVKYTTCGENSLCLKTRSGVYRFPLRNCDNLKAAQIVYDETAGGMEGTRIKVIKDLITTTASIPLFAFVSKFGGSGLLTYGATKFVKDSMLYVLGAKSQDFNIESPCDIKEATVEKVACSDFNYDSSTYINKMNPCTNKVEYPLYKYSEDGKLVSAGSRSVCIEKIGTTIDTVDGGAYGSEEQCVRVFVKSKEGYCWTPDPYKKVDGDFFFNRQEFLSIIPYVSDWIMPVHRYTSIIAHDDSVRETIVLTPTDVALKKGQEFFSQMDRKWWWGWPGV